MSARDVIDAWLLQWTDQHSGGDVAVVIDELLNDLHAMPLSDCLALARALVPEMTVVRVSPFPTVADVPAGLNGAEVNAFCRGWNACRAEVLGSGEDGA